MPCRYVAIYSLDNDQQPLRSVREGNNLHLPIRHWLRPGNGSEVTLGLKNTKNTTENGEDQPKTLKIHITSIKGKPDFGHKGQSCGDCFIFAALGFASNPREPDHIFCIFCCAWFCTPLLSGKGARKLKALLVGFYYTPNRDQIDNFHN